MNKFVFPAAATLAAAILAGGCSGGEQKAAPAGAPVLVAQAFTTNVPVEIDPPPVGHVVAYSTVAVHSQINGILQHVHFKEGSEVESNQLLFTIDPRPSQAALDQARANLQRDSGQLEYQKANYERDGKLLASKIISQDQIDTDKASLDAATGTVAADEAAITNAELNLEFCEIRAPFDGIAGGLQIYEGNVVQAPVDTLVTINQIHPIYVQFGVPEQYLPEIRKEMNEHPLRVSVLFENMDEPPPQGTLTFVDNTVDTSTGLIQLKATFANTNSVLWPGQFVNVTMTLSELTNAVVVPSQAVQTGQDGEFIYVVESTSTNRIAENRPVTTGITYDGETVIEKGVKAGETVVTDGQLRLAPGTVVSIKSASTSTNAP
ncbi:MAG TPA: efflux RND transporter periplasmic adaptor subunit [Verrucomicrobiae bacterium]|nr:efflux RND transporter periplasmic adaptor subunit [Verrucomicrobiae bacterium]